MEDLYNYVNPLNKRHSPMIAKETLDIVIENKAVSDDSFHMFKLQAIKNCNNSKNMFVCFLQRLNSAIIYDRDFSYNFFGFKVMSKFYIQYLNQTLGLNLTFASFFLLNRLLSGHIC